MQTFWLLEERQKRKKQNGQQGTIVDNNKSATDD